MTFTELTALAQTFGVPVALLLWMWFSTQNRPRPASEADNLSAKLDRITDRLDAAVHAFEKADAKIDGMADRLTRVETKVEGIVEDGRPTTTTRRRTTR
jgi:exonuclease VII small subunit